MPDEASRIDTEARGVIREGWTCRECGEYVETCSECLHAHEGYDHVGPSEHMCQWCLTGGYPNDPLGVGPYSGT
jgi:hypothetical protein